MACEDRLGVEVALGRRLAAERVGLVGHAHVQGVAVEVGVDGHGADAQLAAGPDHPDGDLAAVCNEDLLEHAGPFLRAAGLHNCTRRMVSAMWGGSGRSAGSTRSTPPTPMSGSRPARARPRGWSRWPTTRRPAGGASTGAGSRHRGRTCWPRSSCGPDCDGGDVHLCTGAVALAGRRRLPRGGRGRAGAQVAQRPAGRAGPSWPGSWPRRSSSGGDLAAVVVGHRDQRGLAGPGGGRGHLPGRPGRRRRSPSTAGSSSNACSRRSRPRRAAARRRRAGGAALADEVRRRCATLGQTVRVILAGEELSGRAAAIDDAGRLVVETAGGTPRRDAPATWCTCGPD